MATAQPVPDPTTPPVRLTVVPGGQPAPDPPRRLAGRLTTVRLALLVVAAAAPLSALVGTLPLAFVLGNGAGVPAMFAFAGLTLVCFSVGNAAMSRRVVSAGGFYTYVSHGLGRPAAVGSGLLAVVAYNAVTVGLLGAFAYFSSLIAAEHGLGLRWEWWAAAALAVVAVLGHRRIDLSAKVLAVLIAGEFAVLLALDVVVLARLGGSALPATSFAPHTVLAPGIGVAMMLAFCSFVGFESTALYGEESGHAGRTVARATYLAVAVVAVFYAVTSWLVVGAIGADRVGEAAAARQGALVLGVTGDQLGRPALVAAQVMLCTSLFAAVLAMHNATNRYLYVLGRDRVLPRWLGAVHPRHRSPHRAGVVQIGLTVVVVAAFAAAGLDPYLNLSTSMIALGTLGIVVLQALAMLSVIGYFLRRADRHWWRTMLAPALGFAGLAVGTVLVLGNFALLTGTGSVLVTSLPWLLAVAAVAGTGFALVLRRARPDRYARLASADRPD